MSRPYTLLLGTTCSGSIPVPLRLELEGERILGARLLPFPEKNSWRTVSPERGLKIVAGLPGTDAFARSLCYIQAVERAGGWEVPPRGQYVRTAMLELERMASHLLWIARLCRSIGFAPGLHRALRLGHSVLSTAEPLFGAPFGRGLLKVGGVSNDISPKADREVRRMAVSLPGEFESLSSRLLKGVPVRPRIEAVGILGRAEALRCGVTGPVARGSGIRMDLRKSAPGEAYSDIEVDPVLPGESGGGGRGDVRDRLAVRMGELSQSLRILIKIFEGLPEGPLTTEPLAPPSSLGAMGWGIVGAPQGDENQFVRLDGDGNVSLWERRPPGASNMTALPELLVGNELADVALILASVAPVF